MAQIFGLTGQNPAWSSTVVVLSYSYLYKESIDGPLLWKERYFEVPKRILEKAYPGGDYNALKPRAERFYQEMQTNWLIWSYVHL